MVIIHGTCDDTSSDKGVVFIIIIIIIIIIIQISRSIVHFV